MYMYRDLSTCFALRTLVITIYAISVSIQDLYLRYTLVFHITKIELTKIYVSMLKNDTCNTLLISLLDPVCDLEQITILNLMFPPT